MECPLIRQLIFGIFLFHFGLTTSMIPSADDDGLLTSVREPITTVLKDSLMPGCSVIVLTDGSDVTNTLDKILNQFEGHWDIGIFGMAAEDQGKNATQEKLSQLIANAREVRMSSSCVGILVLSVKLDFLEWFADWSLKLRLLVWPSRLLVITSLSLLDLQHLMTTYWIFSQMNIMILNRSDELLSTRTDIYTHMPYTPEGPKMIRLATWTKRKELFYLSNLRLFPEKFENFYGAAVNVSATSYKPLWFESEEADSEGTIRKKLTGMDYLLLTTVAKSLNFSFIIVPIVYWSEALDHMARRETFATPVYHAVLYTRLKRFEYTLGYTYSRISFSMGKPELSPNWQSLYYPLNDQVWLSVLASLIFVIITLILFQYLKIFEEHGDQMNTEYIVNLVVASLLAQSLPGHLPKANSLRMIVAIWLIFAFIIGTAYRGNLTASLTLPKYPPRPETIPQLVANAERVTMAAWGKDFVVYFRKSGSEVFEKLADLMVVNIDTIDGLRQATEHRQAHMETIHKLRLDIAEQFTNIDGSSRLYIGRDSVMPGLAAWPIPHDSPYKIQLDRCISAVVEAGLYEKWTDEMMDLARQVSVKKRREFQEAQPEAEIEEEDKDAGKTKRTPALTIAHMQGPLVLLLIGLNIGAIAFLTEVAIKKCN